MKYYMFNCENCGITVISEAEREDCPGCLSPMAHIGYATEDAWQRYCREGPAMFEFTALEAKRG